MQQYKKTQYKLILVLVGLPARGKTHISYKLNRYLNWIGYKSEIFSIKGAQQNNDEFDQNIDYELEIDPANQQFVDVRQQLSQTAVQQLVQFLQNDGDIALYNGLTSTKADRQKLKSFFKETLKLEYQTFWIESICDDLQVILNNINESKLSRFKDKTIESFINHINVLAKDYQSLENIENLSYIKLINIGKLVKVHMLEGYLCSKIVSFLLNLHANNRQIYLVRSCQTEYHLLDKIGGDPELSATGKQHSQQLGDYFIEELKGNKNITFFSSQMKRGIQTAEIVGEKLGIKALKTKNLDEIDYGICDGLTVKEIAAKYPKQIKERKANPLEFKYPRGESFLDVIHRVEPIIYEIERSREPVLVIAHVAVLKCLYAYYHCNQISEIPNIDIPINCVIKLVPIPYHCLESRVIIK
ncbi:unnamed protein product [Paramecium octaurelia]|uniref:6-phosphofructo-2-kinase domain-containing protein n=1 Tax=Paramecium octaurelia TaxID=43137 RepID=A0A8S1UGH6_PAROT|nr:unnamed protein product [Paramecium octaurelia]